MLLRLWCRPEAAALIRPLAQELPHAAGVDARRKTKKKERIQTLTVCCIEEGAEAWALLSQRKNVETGPGTGMIQGRLVSWEPLA